MIRRSKVCSRTIGSSVEVFLERFIVTCTFITAAIAGKDILKHSPKHDESQSEIKSKMKCAKTTVGRIHAVRSSG